jgi:hypothetical protein
MAREHVITPSVFKPWASSLTRQLAAYLVGSKSDRRARRMAHFTEQRNTVCSPDSLLYRIKLDSWNALLCFIKEVDVIHILDLSVTSVLQCHLLQNGASIVVQNMTARW